jgi:hypothetical protein
MGANLGFASAVAEFGMLRGSKLAGNASYEFVKLVDLADGLRRTTSTERR